MEPATIQDTVLIPLNRLKPPVHNYRRHSDPEKIRTLAESIKRQGLIQNIVVYPDPEEPGAFRMAAGCRRFRALLYGVEQGWFPDVYGVRAVIVTKEEALMVQMAENFHDEKPNPVDEALGFQYLIENEGESVQSLASKLGVSIRTIQERLKLTKTPDLWDALDAGKITMSHAMLIAKVPTAEARAELSKRVLNDKYDDQQVMSHRDLRELIRSEYVITLSKIGFDPTDETLISERGACQDCEFRSGNVESFRDQLKVAAASVNGIDPNTCLNPACWRQKSEAAWHRETTRAEDAGQGSISLELAAEIFHGANGKLIAGCRYVDLDSDVSGRESQLWNTSATWRELLKDIQIAVFIAKHPSTFATHELVEKEHAVNLIRQSRVKPSEANSETEPPDRIREAAEAIRKEAAAREEALKVGAERKKDAAERLEGSVNMLKRLAAAMAGVGTGPNELRSLLAMICERDLDARFMLGALLEVDGEDFEFHLKTNWLIDEEMVLLVLALIAGPMRVDGTDAPGFRRVCEIYNFKPEEKLALEA